MSVNKRLLEILVCPESKTPVKVLTKDRLAILNQAVVSGNIVYIDGERVTDVLEEALITQDNKTIYGVRSGIPVMLPERAIRSDQVPGW